MYRLIINTSEIAITLNKTILHGLGLNAGRRNKVNFSETLSHHVKQCLEDQDLGNRTGTDGMNGAEVRRDATR